MITELADEIMEHLNLGDHLYPDVRTVVEGKLRDRVDKVLEPLAKKFQKKGNTKKASKAAAKDQVLGNITQAMNGLIKSPRLSQEASFFLMKQTALYYEEKYPASE
jgi:hypothetical protein